ncbi:LamG domain-containing protein [Planctomycetota bacterium]|nr:LamG domain-containing protein [Planctomycetota bacterium]
MSAKYKSPSFLLPNEKNTSANPANDTGINSLYSMDFDASSSDYIESSSSGITGNQNRTISVWAKATSVNNKTIICLGEKTGTVTASRFGIILRNSQQIQIITYANDVMFDSSFNWGTINLNDGNWHHYLVTFESGNIFKLYVDNTYIGIKTASASSLNTGSGLFIGAASYGVGPQRFFDGQIDEVAIFNKALNDNERAALYDGTGSNIRPSNLMASNLNPVAYYPLGEQAQNSGYPSATGNEWQFPNGVLQDYVMDFNGGDNISSSLSLNGASSFTVSVWFNPTTLSGSKYILGQWQDGDQSNSTWAIATVGTLLYFFIQDNTGTKVISTNQSTGVWTNAIAIYTGSSIKLYVNNILINTVSAGSLNSGSKYFRIGDDFNGGNGFDGKISNVAIWNTDQSTNIADIYNNGSPQTSYTVSPQNWWKLNADSVYTPSVTSYSRALDFGGTDYIDCGVVSAVENVSSFSMSVWVYPTNGALKSIIGNWGNPYVGVEIGTSSGAVYFTVDSDTGGSGYGATPSGLSNSNWAHLVLVFDGSGSGDSGRLKGYINGVEQTLSYTGTIPATTAAPNRAFRIGDQHVGNGLIGNISNAAVWNTPLSASQALTLFNFGAPETNISFNPTHWWKLDNLTTGIQDSGSASNNGTNNGATDATGGVAVTPSWKIPSALTVPTVNTTSALDFSNGKIDISPTIDLDITTTNTISFWINLTSNTNQNYILSNNGTGTGAQRLTALAYVNIGASNAETAIYSFKEGYSTKSQNEGWRSTAVANSDFSGSWHHVAIVRGIQNISYYYDGQPLGTGTLPAQSTATQLLVDCIGAGMTGSGTLNAKLSNLAIWKSDQSTNISNIYNNGQPQSSYTVTPDHLFKLDNLTTGVNDVYSSSAGTATSGVTKVDDDVYVGNIPVNGVSTTLPSTALQQSDLQFDSPFSNYSLSFDGTGDYIDFGNVNSIKLGAGDFSFSAWINPESYISAYQAIYVNYGTNGVFIGKNPSGDFILRIFGVADIIAYSTLPTTNTWTHICITRNSGTCSLFYNGSSVATATSTHNFNGSGNVFLGSDSGGADFNGKIDETSIFNYGLSEAQVLEIYNNGRPKDLTTFSGTAPVSWWRLGENAYFNTGTTPGPEFTVPNSISGAPNGTGSGTITTMISADAPGTYANGIGTNLDILDRVGDAALSTSNSQSYNMIPSDISPYVPEYVGKQIANNFSMTFDPASNTKFEVSSNSSFAFGTGDFTTSLWAYVATYSNTPYLLDFRTGQTTGMAIYVNTSGIIQVFIDGSTIIGSSGTVLSSGWRNIIVKRDNGTLSTHIDGGSADQSVSNSTNLGSSSNPLVIGARFNSTTQSWPNKIDEVAIWNAALNAGQIYNDIYQPTATGTNQTADLVNNPNLPTPVAWYRMGD